MSFLRMASCLAFAALALAACSKAPEKAASSAEPAPNPSAAAPQAKDQLGPVIPASQLPTIKAGLWEVTETAPGQKPRVERICQSGKQKPLTMGSGCSELTLRRSMLGAYVIDSQCGGGGIALKLHMEARGDFQSRYSLDTTSAIKLPDKPDQVDTSHREARYVGACPAGMTPDE